MTEKKNIALLKIEESGLRIVDFISSSTYDAVVKYGQDMYNKGIEDAVDCANVLYVENPKMSCADCITPIVNTEEILKLKI